MYWLSSVGTQMTVFALHNVQEESLQKPWMRQRERSRISSHRMPPVVEEATCRLQICANGEIFYEIKVCRKQSHR
jgi:hypothetical protein